MSNIGSFSNFYYTAYETHSTDHHTAIYTKSTHPHRVYPEDYPEDYPEPKSVSVAQTQADVCPVNKSSCVLWVVSTFIEEEKFKNPKENIGELKYGKAKIRKPLGLWALMVNNISQIALGGHARHAAASYSNL